MPVSNAPAAGPEKAAETRHPEPLSDPGKQERVAQGVPVVGAFDAYRGVAVVGIVLFHILASSGLVIRAGGSAPAQRGWGTLPDTGAIFFIVSGFVMFLPTAARNGEFGSVSAFAIRRAARLFPALWVVLLISLALLAVLPDGPPGDTTPVLPFPGLGEIVINFSGLATWALLFSWGFPPGFGVDTPIWTLTLEIAFYVVLPLVAALYFRRPLIGLAIAIGIAVVWRLMFENIDDVAGVVGVSLSPRRALGLQFANNQFPHWAMAFGAGMTCAWAYVRLSGMRDRERLERGAKWVAGAALLALGFCVWRAGRYVFEAPPSSVVYTAWNSSALIVAYTLVLTTLMLAVAFIPGRIQAVMAHPGVRWLADLSYGMYLIHAVLLWVIAVQFSPPKDGSLTSFAILFFTVMPLSVIYGYLSARYVEQPIRRWAHKFGRRAQARSAAKPAAASSPGVS